MLRDADTIMGAPASYVALHRSGELPGRAAEAARFLSGCTLCPHRCGADRISGETGFCGTGASAMVASAGPHFGEEPPLVGTGGSGTIFFFRCNMACCFCQNHEISRGTGRSVSSPELAAVMLALQRSGCHNINLVSPSHVIPQILVAVSLAAEKGLVIPLVYNSGGYDGPEGLALLDGVVDIYMPDAKYGSDECARLLSGISGYPAMMMAAIREMHRQVGDLEVENGIARRGLLVRHLVLPAGLAGTPAVMEFLAGISPETYVNVMDQYRWPPDLPFPFQPDHPFAPLRRRITPEEYREAIGIARAAGLRRGFPE
jgi:putative pyruvate formate lyase activating enzyme